MKADPRVTEEPPLSIAEATSDEAALVPGALAMRRPLALDTPGAGAAGRTDG